MLREARVYFQVTETRFTTVLPLPLGVRVWSVEGWQVRGTEHESCSMEVLPSTATLHHGTLVAGSGINKNKFLKEEQGGAWAYELLVPWQKP